MTRPDLELPLARDDDARLRQAIRAGNIGIFEHDHETDAIHWSPELREMYGWDADEPATLPKIVSHVHPDDLALVGAAVQWAHSPDGDGAFDVEHRIFDRRGVLRWVLTRSQTVFHAVAGQRRPRRTVGAVQDVTQRHVAEERLRVLDTVLSSSAQAIGIADARGCLTFANEALRRLWGYPAEEPLLGRSIFDFWTGEEPARALARVRDERILHVELPARRVDGSPFHLGLTAEAVCDSNGVLTQLLVSFTDATASKQVEDALRLKNQAVASALVGIAMTDAAGLVIYANREFLRLRGCSREDEALGQSLWDFPASDWSEQVIAVVASGEAFQGEVVGKRGDGAELNLLVSAHPLRDASGEVVNLVASFADVTDRKRLEAQLVHAQKMESIGRLAGGIAHDFNNLLTVICGGLELGLRTLPPDHPSCTHLRDVAAAAQSAVTLTRQLLAFSRKEMIAPKILDLNEVIGRVRNMILRLLAADIELETRCAADLMLTCFDPGQVEQILLNLAANARDAMPAGGRLTIETSNVELDDRYVRENVGARPGAYVLLAVTDNGTGMTEAVRAHLFEPFFTTKGAGKGTGLGLAMVYGAVQQNGGYVEVQSEVERGTTFKIHLPAATRAAEPPRVRPPATAAKRGRASILLVEDDAQVRALTKNVLSSLGHTVHAFASGEEALNAIASLASAPELLVTDVIMPGINGRIVAERVSAVWPQIRVLFVSGYAEDVIAEHGVLRGGIEFLAKPYTVAQLSRRVQAVLYGTEPEDPPR